MPRDNTLRKILLIGSGPIVIGQGCEFDYSGVQACKALAEEGYEVILVNSNPATIMTDPEFASRTYIEPITPEVVEKIIAREKPDALLPTLGGQTALNCAMDLVKNGALERHNVRLIGANAAAIAKGEDRLLFKEAMIKIGLDVPRSGVAHSLEDARRVAQEIGSFPLIIRPAFTLGGTGGGIAYNREEYESTVARGLDLSPVDEVLIEESLLGWKEFEMEVMRDRNDNCVIICSIENVDPMGVHTGDSITVAPAQTLTDREFQVMRDASFAVIREIGVETGGSNIQFAVNPENGRMTVIEMNPRVSRSSALASKATGFPIAKIAAKLAVGYTLDEVRNDITRETPASFEPTIDYVVTKVPRFTFEKFPQADPTLTTQMKSVGEAMAIGRTFKESLQKALRSLEVKRFGLLGDGAGKPADPEEIRQKLRVPNAERIFYLGQAFAGGMTIEEAFELTRIDPWFLHNIRQIALESAGPAGDGAPALPRADAPAQETRLLRPPACRRRAAFPRRKSAGGARKWASSRPIASSIPAPPSSRPTRPTTTRPTAMKMSAARATSARSIILGGGPNRIGQGIEFDYCCVHAAFALKELGFETIMVNSNPETVSTDYDTSDKLYFEPLTLEDVLNICDQEQPWGVIVQFGGQTPLNLARGLEQAGVPIIGTSPRSIEIAEDRKLFSAMLDKLGLLQTPSGTATNEAEAVAVAQTHRLSRARAAQLRARRAGHGDRLQGGRSAPLHPQRRRGQPGAAHPRGPLPRGRRGGRCRLHLRRRDRRHRRDHGAHRAGRHPFRRQRLRHPRLLPQRAGKDRDRPRHQGDGPRAQRARPDERAVRRQGREGLRPRGQPARLPHRPLRQQGHRRPAGQVRRAHHGRPDPRGDRLHRARSSPTHFSVKEAVFPFIKFPGVDIALGPEMKSTGEVMGIDADLGIAYAKAQMAAQPPLPLGGNIFISVKDSQKPDVVDCWRGISPPSASRSTPPPAPPPRSRPMARRSSKLFKLAEGRPNVLDMIKNGEISFIINTPAGKTPREDEVKIRSAAVAQRIPIMTTMRAAKASLHGITLAARAGLRGKMHPGVSPERPAVGGSNPTGSAFTSCLRFPNFTGFGSRCFSKINPPHFHVKYGECKAEIDIRTLGLLKGWLPPKAQSLVIEWAHTHREETAR